MKIKRSLLITNNPSEYEFFINDNDNVDLISGMRNKKHKVNSHSLEFELARNGYDIKPDERAE